MPKIPTIKAKDFLKYLIKYGCTELTTHGSHHKVKYKNKISIVAIHNKDYAKGSFSGILSQLEINIDDFIEFIEKN